MYHAILVALLDKFKARLRDVYQEDTHWKKVMDMLNDANDEALTNGVNNKLKGINFIKRDGIIYFINYVTQIEKLYIL